MSKIIKTTAGVADFTLKEVFENEDKAKEGKNPDVSDVKIEDLKINFTKYKQLMDEEEDVITTDKS
jgi:hypothetical protein|tara:strand:+ start:609 stop:806 length:198 start_codon:yes stop_codon:yes gene_type:complete